MKSAAVGVAEASVLPVVVASVVAAVVVAVTEAVEVRWERLPPDPPAMHASNPLQQMHPRDISQMLNLRLANRRWQFRRQRWRQGG